MLPVTELKEGGGWGGLGERIAGGNQVFYFEHVKLKTLIRHLVTLQFF